MYLFVFITHISASKGADKQNVTFPFGLEFRLWLYLGVD